MASARTWAIGPDRAWSGPELAVATAVIALVYLSVFTAGMLVLPTDARRKRSWLLTTVSSTGTSVAGIYFGYRILRDGLHEVLEEDPFTHDHGASVLTVIFFAVYLVLDLIVGATFYREQMTVLSGWLHHTTYLGIVCWLHTENLHAAFAAFLLSEIPTALMSYGQLDKTWRTDLYFGLTYLVTRLIYHGYLFYLFLERWTPGWAIIGLSFLMHIHWFREWVVSQRRKGILKDIEYRWRGLPPPAKPAAAAKAE